jgi:hypothetical protein
LIFRVIRWVGFGVEERMKPIHSKENKPDAATKEETPKQTSPPITTSHNDLNRDQYHDANTHYRNYKKTGSFLDPGLAEIVHVHFFFSLWFGIFVFSTHLLNSCLAKKLWGEAARLRPIILNELQN